MVYQTEADIDREAQRILRAILEATWTRIEATRRALRAAFAGEGEHAGSAHTIAGDAEDPWDVGVHDVERCAAEWRDLVPADPGVRAALIDRLSEEYVFSKDAVPDMGSALGFDDAEVERAYEARFGRPMSGVFAATMPPDERPFWFRFPGMEQPDTLRELTSLFEWVTLTSGDTLCRQGETGHRMFAVVSGRLKVVHRDGDGGEHVLAERGRGAIIGELAVLTDDFRRTATIYATRDSELIALSRDAFERLSAEQPALALFIMREIIGLLRGALTGSCRRSDPVGIAVVPLASGLPVAELVRRCARALGERWPVLVLDRETMDRLRGPGVADLPPEDPAASELVWWLNALEDRYRFVFYVAEPQLSEWTQRCLRVADRVWLVGDGDAPPEPGPIDPYLREVESRGPTAGRELILLHASNDPPADTQRWLAGRHLVRHHHLCMADSGSCERLARFAERRAVGLVLSGGAARGLAHIGVVRALEEARIPVDAVAGTSFGAIVAGVMAIGWDWQRISDVMHEFAAHTRRYFRIALPMMSVMEGRPLDALFRKYYGDVRIEDLWTPFFCIASNLSRSSADTLDSGLLWRSVRASMAIPSLFPPVIEDGDLLVDGGVMNNMPADIMKARLEGGRVLSSNVSIDAAAAEYRYPEGITSWRMAFDRLRSRGGKSDIPNIAEVAIKTMTLSSHWAVPAQVKSSDLLIECPVGDYTMFAYDSIDELIEIGYRAAAEALERWETQTSRGRSRRDASAREPATVNA